MKRKFRPHSPEYFIRELTELISIFGIEHFHIVDDCFTYDTVRLKEICNLIIDKDLKITWTCFGRVDTLQNIEIVKLMKKAGCVLVILGIETGNQRISDLMRKENSKMAEIACYNLKVAKIDFFNSFIIGNEGETKDSINDTVQFSKKLDSVMAAFNIMVPFPGTTIFRRYYNDYDKPETDWNNWCSVGDDIAYDLRHTELSRSDILKLTSKAYNVFYFDPVQLFRILSYSKNPTVILSFLREGFGLFRQVFNWY